MVATGCNGMQTVATACKSSLPRCYGTLRHLEAGSSPGAAQEQPRSSREQPRSRQELPRSAQEPPGAAQELPGAAQDAQEPPRSSNSNSNSDSDSDSDSGNSGSGSDSDSDSDSGSDSGSDTGRSKWLLESAPVPLGARHDCSNLLRIRQSAQNDCSRSLFERAGLCDTVLCTNKIEARWRNRRQQLDIYIYIYIYIYSPGLVPRAC